MNKIKAILFDMDGVLIDAKDWHYEALNKALNLANIEISKKDHLNIYDGLPTQKKLDILSERYGLDKSLHSTIQKLKQQYTVELIHRRCKPTTYHLKALEKLKKEGYKMAVCSNSIRETINIMMHQSKLEDFFEFYISNQDVKQGKPHPEMYHKAIKKLKLTPKECLIIEDSEIGIKAAIDSGAFVMKINTINEVNYDNILGNILIFEKS